MNVKIEITKAKLHTDPATGDSEIKFSGSLSLSKDVYPDDVTAESVGEALVVAIEQKLYKKKNDVRDQEQE